MRHDDTSDWNMSVGTWIGVIVFGLVFYALIFIGVAYADQHIPPKPGVPVEIYGGDGVNNVDGAQFLAKFRPFKTGYSSNIEFGVHWFEDDEDDQTFTKRECANYFCSRQKMSFITQSGDDDSNVAVFVGYRYPFFKYLALSAGVAYIADTTQHTVEGVGGYIGAFGYFPPIGKSCVQIGGGYQHLSNLSKGDSGIDGVFLGVTVPFGRTGDCDNSR